MKRKTTKLEQLKLTSFPTTDVQAKGGKGECQFHTARHHYCSDAGCYSDYCNSTDCNSGVYPV
ncbi:hypothetical protein AB9P05_02615 [Roseivirga sp. BDSF3-8]|uniref:hypothetical protein n=1 Tax=Roseivirga sp. BDSF3-8 TaxID=3241598 RepID=UPI00353213A5